jgi:hypothetical protein
MTALNTHHTAPAAPPTFLMKMGCTQKVITYRAAGNEGVCLQSPEHGMQQLAGFNPANGDLIGLDDILEKTLAHADLSDVGNYITSQIVSGSTILYFDPTGHGLQGSAIAMLQGVSTTVAALVANHGIAYVPDQVVVTPQFNVPLTIRPDGLETVALGHVVPGAGPQIIDNFNPAQGDLLELANILNRTTAMPNLNDLANYVTVTNVGGDTILSVDKTGHGGAGTPFADLHGVTMTLSQLLAANALAFDPTNVMMRMQPNTTFTFRAEGGVTAMLNDVHGNTGTNQLANFNLGAGDGIDIAMILNHAGLTVDFNTIQNYFSTTEQGGNTNLYFDPTGSGHGGTLEATLQNTSVTLNDLLAHSAVHLFN